MPFESGKSGNPGGRNKTEKLFRDALNVAVKRTDGDQTMLARIASALVSKAATGDVPAINAIADRLDGKPQQDMTVEHTGEVTFRSAAISAIDELIAGAAAGRPDSPHKDALPN